MKKTEGMCQNRVLLESVFNHATKVGLDTAICQKKPKLYTDLAYNLYTNPHSLAF